MPTHTEEDDPYKDFRFKILWDGRYVAGIGKITGGQKRSTKPIEFKEGGDPRFEMNIPAMTFYEPVTLERGVTQDLEFEKWANTTNDHKNDKGTPPKEDRRDIAIVEMDENGTPVLAFNLFRCWISECQSYPYTNEGDDAVAIQTIRLENEGWERIKAYKGPRRTRKSRYSIYLSPTDTDRMFE
ncbi:MAG: phage tail protein [Thermoplasmata archaeon]|nr:phage tail protein [Thermoplasmata archaeon]